jgi:hypothetical protein
MSPFHPLRTSFANCRPPRKRCEHEGCEKVAVQGGKCIGHGAKKKRCEIEGCTKQSCVVGRCIMHGSSLLRRKRRASDLEDEGFDVGDCPTAESLGKEASTNVEVKVLDTETVTNREVDGTKTKRKSPSSSPGKKSLLLPAPPGTDVEITELCQPVKQVKVSNKETATHIVNGGANTKRKSPPSSPEKKYLPLAPPPGKDNLQTIELCRPVTTQASTRRRRCCAVDGCDNRTVQGGVCIAHGAKRRKCSVEGCDKNSKTKGKCATHG